MLVQTASQARPGQVLTEVHMSSRETLAQPVFSRSQAKLPRVTCVTQPGGRRATEQGGQWLGSGQGVQCSFSPTSSGTSGSSSAPVSKGYTCLHASAFAL